VLFIGGIFARCLDVEVFQDARKHLDEAHMTATEHLPVYGNGSSEQNAQLIATHLREASGSTPYIVVGHSKGGVDLLETWVHHADIRPRIKALVTVASPVAGSRLVDGVPDILKALSLKLPNIGTCPLGDGLGYVSLARATRQRFVREHLGDVNALRSYSVTAVASEDNTSRILQGLWRYQATFSLDQDSHVIADDAVLPGAVCWRRPTEIIGRWLRRSSSRKMNSCASAPIAIGIRARHSSSRS
jgi:pimeloyl-ACP methyl ester carboxylesterase